MQELFIKCNSDIIDIADNFSTLTLEIVLRDILDLCSLPTNQKQKQKIYIQYSVCFIHIVSFRVGRIVLTKMLFDTLHMQTTF